jgi:hypothetical protein
MRSPEGPGLEFTVHRWVFDFQISSFKFENLELVFLSKQIRFSIGNKEVSSHFQEASDCNPRRSDGSHGDFEMLRHKTILNSALAVAVIATLTVLNTTHAAAKICKQGRVHYAPGAFSHDKWIAKSSAIKSWRNTYVGFNRKFISPKPQDVKCMQAENRSGWRCYVKASSCASL